MLLETLYLVATTSGMDEEAKAFEWICDNNWPAFLTQLFLLTSEGYFACQSMDLYSSLRNPFYSYRTRIKMYHICSWSLGIFAASIPLMSRIPTQIYGLDQIRNVNVNDDGEHYVQAMCWFQKDLDKNYLYFPPNAALLSQVCPPVLLLCVCV